ncbi:MAG: hypothetical protein FD123_1655 [Bacteroidetes bacterium]|nr:MAG: hypothetical protein FD123_1655 [Bacteroidota bacterium]
MKTIKSILKKTGWVLLIAFVVIQFFRPEKNISTAVQPKNISTAVYVPAPVDTILRTSCYDCHSNNTVYPWYSYVQPFAWWLGDHVNEGKGEINFDDFASYRLRRQFHKIEEIEEMVVENEMPLSSYTLIHRDAVLSDDQKKLLTGWCHAVMDTMKAHYPEDSLKRPAPARLP